MLHNTGRSVDADAPAERRLASNVADLFTSGTAAGARVQDLMNDLADCSVEGFTRKEVDQNTARYLRRRLSKYSSWPPLFEHTIMMKDPDPDLETEEQG